MSEEFTINEILDKIKFLYKSYDDSFKYIKEYNKKYDIVESKSIEILNLEKNNSYKIILDQLTTGNFDDVNNHIEKSLELIGNIHKFILSELAHKYLKEIELRLDNPFFFRKLRKDYRKLINELNTVDDEVLNNIENFNELKFENIIERSRTLEYEIEDEERSGLYSIVTKTFVWGIPILIGIYQLIAMKFLNFNPYFPLAFYMIIIFLVYLSLKSISNIKILYSGIMKKKLFLIIFSSAIFTSIFYIFIIYYIKPSIEALAFPFILFIVLFIILISLSKMIIERTKEELVQNELMNLLDKFNIKIIQ